MALGWSHVVKGFGRAAALLAVACSTPTSPEQVTLADTGISFHDAQAADTGETAADASHTGPDATQASTDAAQAADAQAVGVDAAWPLDAGRDADTARDAGGQPNWVLGVNVHPYPKPTAYGYTTADGADRMGNGLTSLGVTHVRAGAIGETAFLERLASFGVTQVILMVAANGYGKPFDPAQLEVALDASLARANALGITIQVEGLNEWDLFHSRAYNDGVRPAGMNDTQFIAYTQHALYVAAHARGLLVLGPSVGHGTEQDSLMMFPNVSADVDIVNVHLYFGPQPEQLPIATILASHTAYQGANKPVWVTETGTSAYNGVDANEQADLIERGVNAFRDSNLIDAVFVYELLDGQKPGFNGTSFVPDNAEYHFGLFTFEGADKPVTSVFRDLVASTR